MKPVSLALSLLALAALACNLGAPVASPALTEVPPLTAQPAAPSSPASPSDSLLNPRALDTAGMEECALVADSDFSALLGQNPADKVPEAEINKTACYYNFSGGQTVYVTLITDLPGKQVYDSRMQYLDSAAGTEAVTLGETALLQERDGLISIQAVVNGWYLNLESRGFDRKAVIALARLFEGRLIAYPQQAAEPTAPAAGGENPAPAGLNQCQNLYYPIVQGASWEYQLSGMSSGTFTRSIPAVRPDGFDDQDVFSAGTTRQGSWACQNGNLISLTPSSAAAVTAAGVTAAYAIESNSGMSFPANPQPGQEWSQNIVYLGQETTNGVNIETRNVMEMTCKAGNIETIKVPAGEFQALRIDCSTKIDIYVSGNLAFTFTSSSAAWHAAGVGMVKSSGTSNMGDTDIVLLAYNIP